MRMLDRHIFRELLGPFIFGVAAFTSIMFAGKDLFIITELLAEYHASVASAVKLLILVMPTIIVMTLPMSMLLAALIGFGRLSSDSEVVALFAGGIGFHRIVIPAVIMGILVTGAALVLNEYVVPWTFTEHEKQLRQLRNEPVSSDKDFLVVDSKDGVTNRFFYVQGGYDASRNTLRKVTLVEFKDNKPSVISYGNEAVWDGGSKWTFRDGYTQSLGPGQSYIVSFKEFGAKIDKAPRELALYQKKPEEMNFTELKKYINFLRSEGRDVRWYRVRLYQKLSLPLASLVFALIGAPLGLRPHRSSSAMGLGLSIVIIFAYWVLIHYMTILGDNGAISPATASFLPNLAAATAGIVLIARASK